MKCTDVSSCFDEIKTYCNGASMGYALLVNTENYDTYQSILAMMQADCSKTIICVSDCCTGNALPKIDDVIDRVKGSGCYVLVGISQFTMLQSSESVRQCISKLLELQVRGHLIVLLDHCEQYLNFFINQDLRKDRRIVLLEGEKSPLPGVRLAKNESVCIGQQPKKDIKELLATLEKVSSQMMEISSEIAVITPFSSSLFKNSLYSVSDCDGIYQMLVKSYPDIAAGTQEYYGSEEQWRDLAMEMHQHGTLSAVLQGMFGSIGNLSTYLRDVIDSPDCKKLWYLWIGMKVMGTHGQPYLSEVIKNTKNVDELEFHIYMDLLNHSYKELGFLSLYTERKRLIDAFPENLKLIDLYCNRVGKHEKSAVYYLTDSSEKEEFQFLRCLSIYDYAEQEILDVTLVAFPEIHAYLQNFVFTSANMKLAQQDTPLREQFTDYFRRYKIQKVTNKIDKAFILEIENAAVQRPYNHLPNRIGIVKKKIQQTSQIFFFDALGVEYLSYIQQKCEKYGMIADIQIARCELPSITEKNKEFTEVYPDKILKIDDLDELKHHSQKIDYRNCKMPIHLFRELEIIDDQLRKIQSGLLQGHYDNAVIVSDHGASRLAVIYEHESQSSLSLDEKGEHSGRCCPSESDPKIPFAAYENGYAVLANYERFRGGRKANVEVHGGASLEEVLVPIIALSKRPEELYICFINSLIEIKPKEVAKITVFSNIPLKNPTLHVNGKIYKGELSGDDRHFTFAMPDLKRSRNCVAALYDGDEKLASELPFRVQTTVAKTNDRMSI